MELSVAGFEWDQGNWPKCGKHGVSRDEIEALFSRSPAVYADAKHSLEEQRLLAIGTTEAGRWLLVAFALRRYQDETVIRPISARYMHRREVSHYERQR
ncbi:MAG: BrnT family toxin [Kiloniellales bacterium]